MTAQPKTPRQFVSCGVEGRAPGLGRVHCCVVSVQEFDDFGCVEVARVPGEVLVDRCTRTVGDRAGLVCEFMPPRLHVFAQHALSASLDTIDRHNNTVPMVDGHDGHRFTFGGRVSTGHDRERYDRTHRVLRRKVGRLAVVNGVSTVCATRTHRPGGPAVCRVGRRCFPHTADRLDRAEQEVRRLQLTHDARLATAARQPTSQAWLDQSAGELDQARRKLQQQRIDLASTARGVHNLMLEAHAHEQCGQPEQAAELRRLVTRGLARRRAADIAANPAAADGWTPPQVRGGGDRCPACGQFAAASHRCPSVILDARRLALTASTHLPPPTPATTAAGTAAAQSLSTSLYQDIPLTAADADAITTVCRDDRYGPLPQGLPEIPRRADGSLDTNSAEFAAHRDMALDRAQRACIEDDHIDGEPVPVVLSQGALEPFAVPVKRDNAARLGDELAAVEDRELFDDAECAALAAPDRAQWGQSAAGLCWRTANDEPWRQIGTGERVDHRMVTPSETGSVAVLARRTVASQAMSAWAAHTERDMSPAAVHMQSAVRDVFVHPDADLPQSVEARRARAVVQAQYALT